MTDDSHPAGTLRYRKDDGSWVLARPNSPLYSMVSFLATEYWDEESKAWKPIYDEPEQS